MGSYKHTQALEKETQDLHSIATAQLKLIWARRAVVHHCYT